MQSLAQRHEDRAQRKAMNKAEGALNGGTATGLGSVALAYRQFAQLRSRLGDDESLHKQLDDAIAGIDAEFAGGYRSLAEAPDGSGDTMAGIGVVNPLVVPAATLARSDEGKGHNVGNDAAWGETPPVTVAPLPKADLDTANGQNLNGKALSDQLGDAGGWGTKTPTTKQGEGENGDNGSENSGDGGNA